MITYRDRTFCASKVAGHSCGREFTDYDKEEAERLGLPVAWGEFCQPVMGLQIEDFERHTIEGSFGHYYEHALPNGDRICLESCLGGYCVAKYPPDEGLSIGEKQCTNLGREYHFSIFADETGEGWDRARIKALAYANALV